MVDAGVPVIASARRPSRFGEGRRPETATQVQMAEFDGPLALLLSLIEARQLDVLTVPLGALADAYLDALGDARGRPARQRQRVRGGRQPADPDQEPRDAAPAVGQRPDASARTTARSRGRAARPPDPLPRAPRRRPAAGRGAPWTGSGCSGASRGAAHAAAPGRRPARRRAAAGPDPPGPRPRPPRGIAPPPEPPPEVVAADDHARPSAPTIIRAALRDAPTVVLQDLLGGVRDRVVIAVTFLAMLELMKRREIVVSRPSRGDRSWRARRRAEERAAAGVDADAADAPLDESLESFA